MKNINQFFLISILAIGSFGCFAGNAPERKSVLIEERDIVDFDLFSSQSFDEILVVVEDILGNISYSKVVITDHQEDAYISMDPNQKLLAGSYKIIGSADNDLFNEKLIVW